MKSAAIAALLLTSVLCSSAFAGGDLPATAGIRFRTAANSVNLLSGAALNGAVATRRVDIPVGLRWPKLRVAIFYTYGSATTLTAAFECALDGSNFATLTSRSCTAGSCTDYIVTDTRTTNAANASYMLEYDSSGCNMVRITFGGSGVGSSDLITVQATGTAG